MVGGREGEKQRSKEKVFPSTAKKSVFAASNKEEIETSKALSIAEDNLAKNLQSSNSHASPASEQFKGTTSQMDGQGIDVSTKVSIKRMSISEHHNHSGSKSICSLFSENVNGKVHTSAPDISQHIEMLEVNTVRTAKAQKVNDLGCEGDSTSCISKADGTNLEISGHLVDNDQKNLTGSSTSVTSFCQEGPEKPIDVQSINHGCISSECIAEEGIKCRGSSEFARETLQSAADISDRSDPSETSSLRDEQGAVSPKVESVSPARDTDFLTTQKSDAEIDSNGGSTVALNKLEQKQHSEMRMAHDMQEPPLQYHAVVDHEDSDELIDVRVCDICGDVGREALLAICSKCSDGAEHIYCMRFKMDKVPGGDWMCEDCTVMAEAQKQKAEEQKIGKASQKSSTDEVAQTSRKLDLSGDNGRVRMGLASLAPSRKRPGLNVEVCSSSKRRALDNDVKLSSPGSYLKAGSPRPANLKIPTKSEVASPSGRSFTQNVLRKVHEKSPGRSSKFESQVHKGSVFKQKLGNCTDLRTVRESEDAHREQKTPRGSATFVAGPQHALTKLTKSKSFTTSSVARIDRTDSKKNLDNDFKIPKVGSKRSISQRSYSFNSKISQPASPNVNSSISMVKPAKVTPAPVEVKQRVVQNSHHAAKTADVRKELERASIHRVAKRQCDSNGSGFDRKISSSLADKGRSSGTSGRISTVSLSQKAERNGANVEEEHKLKDTKYQLNDTDKVQLNGLPSGAAVVLTPSTHPDVDCVWRGMLNLECNKLPICCSGLQAHLSTSASPKAFEVVSKLPSEITVKEVLQQDIWPAQFRENRVTENDIALYFFAEDNESYRRYKRFLNCMMLNDLALMANLDGIELLIFHSQVLPARSRRWNNLFFLWGVFRAKRSNYSDEACVPSSKEDIQIPKAETVTLPQNPLIQIPTTSEPINLNVSTRVDPGLSAAEAVSVSVLGSGFSSQGELLQSSVSTKTNHVEAISVNEVGGKALESPLTKKEQQSGEMQSTNEGEKENTSADQDPTAKPVEERLPSESGAEISAEPTSDIKIMNDVSLVTEEKHQAETPLNYPTIDVNVPVDTNVLNGSPISLNSSPSNSQGTETPDEAMEHRRHHHDFNLELPLLSENEQLNDNGDDANVEGGDGFVSLDLSLALPSTANDPVPMMEDPLPEMDDGDDDVDTSLCLFFGGKKA